MDLEFIRNSAEEYFNYMVEARRHIHANPELSEMERGTQKYVRETLNKEGVYNIPMADTGVMAVVKGALPGNVVGLRADMDALPVMEPGGSDYASTVPGVMHACGHDAHTAIQLGAARFFNTNRDKLPGTVKFFFQPAEETVGGAKRMMDEGCMDNPAVGYVLGLHVAGDLDYDQAEIRHGTLNASTNSIRITVKGKSGHAAYPDRCVDPIVISAQMISALQSIVSRNISPLDSAVFTIGKIYGGTKSNIIAGEVVMEGTIRASNSGVRRVMIERIEAVSRGVAGSMGGACEIEYLDGGYPPVINDTFTIDTVKDAALEYLGTDKVIIGDRMSMGGEDFSFFSEKAKTAFYNIGCRVAGKAPYLAHTPEFEVDERCLKTGFAIQILSALKLLSIHPQSAGKEHIT